MKVSVFFVVSICANLVLGFLWWRGATAYSADVTIGPASALSLASTGDERAGPSSSPRTGEPAPMRDSSRTRVWSRLVGEDLEETVRRLRAAGFPPEAVRAIVHELVSEEFEPRRRALYAAEETEAPYWKNPGAAPQDPARMAKLNELVNDEMARLRKLLGEEFAFATTDPVRRERQYGSLPEEKIAALQRIANTYRERTAAVIHDIVNSGRPLGLADEKPLVELGRAERAEIAQALTPDELFEYDLRNHREASRLLTDTRIFQPTEEEFRALFPVYAEIGERVMREVAAGGEPMEAARLYGAAEAEMQDRLKAVLGPERYADFLQAKDPAHEKLNRIVQRLELPLSAARAVADVQHEITRRSDAVKADASLTSEQRATQLAALGAEAASRIEATLGQRGFRAYEQYSGRWLQGLRTSGRK